MHPVLGVTAALVGALAFVWTAASVARVLRRRPRSPAAGEFAGIALGLAAFVAVGGPGFGFLLERWRERGVEANRLVLGALPVGFAWLLFLGMRGIFRRRITSRTGILTGRQAVEYGVLMTLLAAVGLALTAPLLVW